MNFTQMVLLILAITSAAISVLAIILVIKSKEMKRKWLWVVGCLSGNFGYKANWTSPDNIFFWLGVEFPPASSAVFVNGDIFMKAGMPVIALVAIVRSYQLASVAQERSAQATFE